MITKNHQSTWSKLQTAVRHKAEAVLQTGQRTLQKSLAGMKARAANHDLSKQWKAAASIPTMSRNEALRQAGQRLIKQGTAPTDLPPSIQAAYMQAQKQQSEARFRRTVASHNNDAGVQGQTPKLQVGKTALQGLSQAAQAAVDAKDRLTGQYDVKQAVKTERDLKTRRDDQRLRTLGEARYTRHQKNQSAAEASIKADTNPETWRRHEVAAAEKQRSQAVLGPLAVAAQTRPQAERYLRQQALALESIKDSSAPEAADRALVGSNLDAHEKAQLSRDRAGWLKSLPAHQQARLTRLDAHDRADLMKSGLQAAEARNVIADVATMGLNQAARRGDWKGLADGVATLGASELAIGAGRDLGRGSAYVEQASQLGRIGAEKDAESFSSEGRIMLAVGTLEAAGMIAAGKGAIDGARSIANGVLSETAPASSLPKARGMKARGGHAFSHEVTEPYKARGLVISQSEENSCVAACGKMLLAEEEMPEAYIRNLAHVSRDGGYLKDLPEALRTLGKPGYEHAADLTLAQLEEAAARGPVAVVVQTPRTRSMHALMVDGFEGGKVLIRDPLPYGTRRGSAYKVAKEVFSAAWKTQAVFKR